MGWFENFDVERADRVLAILARILNIAFLVSIAAGTLNAKSPFPASAASRAKAAHPKRKAKVTAATGRWAACSQCANWKSPWRTAKPSRLWS